MPTTVDTLVCLTCVALSSISYFLLTSSDRKVVDKDYAPPSSNPVHAYLLETTVTHARLHPSPSTHKFTYPVLSFFFPLRTLECNRISLLNGWLLCYGGIRARLIGLRADNYLYDDGSKEKSVRRKLGKVLRDFDVADAGIGKVFEGEEPRFDAWMMTMPAYLGFEGINPLTVYFCYHDDAPDELWIVVLEVR